MERLDVLKQRYVEELKSLEEVCVVHHTAVQCVVDLNALNHTQLQALNAKIKQLHAMQAMAGTRAMVQAEEAINRGIDGSTLTSEVWQCVLQAQAALQAYTNVRHPTT